jgi:hypothetical protein
MRAAKAWRSLAHSKLLADVSLMSNDEKEENTQEQIAIAVLPA